MLNLNKVNFSINKNDDEINLIKDANINISESSFVAVVGPSGCGKTTLLRIIAGINAQSSGNIYWKGRDLSVNDFNPSELGFVPQFSIAYDQLTISESIKTAIKLRSKCTTKEEINNILDKVISQTGLKEISERQVKVLSGGQMRRLSLAIELVTEPQLLLCDEVTSGLDPKSEHEIVSLMHSLSRNSDRVVVNVTHSLNHLELYDTIIVLYEGYVVYQGSPSKLTHYFSVNSAEEIYPTLTNRKDIDWHISWLKHREKYITASEVNDKEYKSPNNTLPPSALNQFLALTIRRWKIFSRDKMQILLHLGMLLLFPILVAIFGLDGIDQPKTMPNQTNANVIDQLNYKISVSKSHMEIGSLISGLVMFQVILLTLMASNNSAREIAGEREIFEKEKFSGLSVSSYILSKVAFLSVLVLLQSLWMGIFVQICVPSLPGDIVTRLIILILVNASMTSICLGISASMKSPEQSSLLAIYLVGFQLPLSGAILSLPQWISPITQPLISAYWAWSGSLDLMKGEYFGQSIDAVTKQTNVQSLNICIVWLCLHLIFGLFLTYTGSKKPQI